MTDLLNDIMLACITVLPVTMVTMMTSAASSITLPDVCVCECYASCAVFSQTEHVCKGELLNRPGGP